jgi:MFS family permease
MALGRFGRRVIHLGLLIEAIGLAGVFTVLHYAGAGVDTVELLVPMVVGGMGMGMVFVPLFDIVMAGVRPHEMGSASGVLQSTNGLAMSLGVGGLGAVFFGLVGTRAVHVQSYLHAAEWTALLTVILLAGAFAIAFKLPHAAQQFNETDAITVATDDIVNDQAPEREQELVIVEANASVHESPVPVFAMR